MIDILTSSGLTTVEAARVFVPVAVTTAVVNLASGVLVDRVPIRVILSGALIALALSLWLAPRLHGVEWAFFYGVVLGAMSGLQRTVSTVVWAAYFGRRHLGSITGVSSTLLVAASALGPMPFGIARDMLGNYLLVLSFSAIFPAVLAITNLFTDKPQKI
jgi:MFS family permease